MKKLFLVALLVVGMTTFAQEQRGERKERFTPEQRVDFQIKKMTKDLNLDEKQAEQVKVLLTQEAKKREAKRAEMEAKKAEQARPSKEEMEARKSEMKANQEAMKAEMKKILSADQYTKWEQKQEERKDKMVERMKDKKKKRGESEDNEK